MITIKTSGSFNKTETFLNRLKSEEAFRVLQKYGEIGKAALAAATPVDSGETANSWTYEIVNRRGYHAIHWSNTHVENGLPIAILIQYGHGTRNGGYVQGRDYIMPAARPVFEQIVSDVWREVTK